MQIVRLNDNIRITEFRSESLSEALSGAASAVDSMTADTYAHSIATEFSEDGWKVILFWGTDDF